ncbi:MAG: hypothetical protein V8T48_00955 [Oscillospiraceae bacterium]
MKKMTAFLVTLCMLAALLAGCGGASKSTQAFDAAERPRRGGEWRLL